MVRESRRHPRLCPDARIDVMGSEVVLHQPVRDLSLGGVRLDGPGWEPIGAQVQVVLCFPALNASLPLVAEVVRSDLDALALAFIGLGDEQNGALAKCLDQAGQVVARS